MRQFRQIKLGMISDYEDNTFWDMQTISKDQIIAVAARILMNEAGYYGKRAASAQWLAFVDKDILGRTREDFALTARESLVVQRTDGTFASTEPITQEDTAIIVRQLFDKL